MAINGCELKLSWEGDVPAALDRAAETLQGLGYTVKARGASSLELAFKGAIFTANPEKMRHTLSVDVYGGVWHFQYSTGLIASVWSERDVAWATARAQSVIDAL